MFYYEIKKIFQRKVNLVAMILGYVILMVATIYPIFQEYDYLYEEEKAIQGVEAVQYHKQFAKQQTDELTEEYLTEILQDMQEGQKNPLTDDGFLYFNAKYGNLFHYLVKSYQPIGETDTKWDCLQHLDISSGASFYDRRIQRIVTYLNENFSYGNYSEAEKEYWIRQAKAVKIPFQWGDTFVMKQYDTVIGMGFYLLFVLFICLSSIFSGESKNGIEGLLLSTKHGQRKLVAAKCAAAYCFGFIYIAIGYLMSFVWLYVVIGMEGLFLPMFIPFSENSRLFNRLLALTIARIVDLQECLVTFMDYQIGSCVLDLPTFAVIEHLVAGVILVCLVRKIYVWKGIHAGKNRKSGILYIS